MSRTLLIIGGGIEAVPGIRTAREMGLTVVVSDRDSGAPGFAQADYRLQASTYDIEATVGSVRQFHCNVRPIDGVICIASDIALTVATVAAELGLPGISLDAAHFATDKLAMKEAFARANVPVPWFQPLGSARELRGIVEKEGFSLVIKPVDNRGARGVLRLAKDVNLDWAFKYSTGHSPTGGVMVEKFLDGPQVSTESIMLDGIAYTPGLSDRNYEYLDRYSPHVIENGGDLPTALPDNTQALVRHVVAQAAHAMGINQWTVKGDVVIHNGQPYIIELAARLSGGYFATDEIPLSTGVEFVEQAIKLALGEELHPKDLEPKYHRPVSQRYLFPVPGRVVSIAGVDEVSHRPEVDLCEVRVQIGSVIPKTESHPARAGVVITHGDTREAAAAAAVAAVNGIIIETVPVTTETVVA